MKNTISKEITFTLVLTESEAAWLHNIMQNPLQNKSLINESSVDSSMRILFFNATLPNQ